MQKPLNLLLIMLTLCIFVNGCVPLVQNPEDFSTSDHAYQKSREILINASQKKKGEYQSSQTGFLLALDLNPQNYLACDGLGSYYFRIGDYVKSIRWFKNALAIEPIYARAHAHLGDVYYSLKQLEVSRQHYEQAISLDPYDPHILNNYASLLLRIDSKKFYDIALAMLKRAAFIADGTKDRGLISSNILKTGETFAVQ